MNKTQDEKFQKMLDLPLNDHIKITKLFSTLYITRTPGGWVYTYIMPDGNSSAFVPIPLMFRQSGLDGP